MADENVTYPEAELLHLSPVGWEPTWPNSVNVRRSAARIVSPASTPAAGDGPEGIEVRFNRLVASSTKAIESN